MCWNQCGQQPGSCEYCSDGSQQGYCCRKDGMAGGNGDCPQSALDGIPDDTDSFMWSNKHLCVIQRGEKYHLT